MTNHKLIEITNYTAQCRTELADTNKGPTDIFYEQDANGLLTGSYSAAGAVYPKGDIETDFKLISGDYFIEVNDSGRAIIGNYDDNTSNWDFVSGSKIVVHVENAKAKDASSIVCRSRAVGGDGRWAILKTSNTNEYLFFLVYWR